jgi:hypothetical protein
LFERLSIGPKKMNTSYEMRDDHRILKAASSVEPLLIFDGCDKLDVEIGDDGNILTVWSDYPSEFII